MGKEEKNIIMYPLKEHYPKGFGLCFGYVMCDTTLSVQARCVFSLLSTFVDWSSGENTCFPERATIYGSLKISRSLLSKYLNELHSHDLLTVETRKKKNSVLQDSNIYTLNLRPRGFRSNPTAAIFTNDIREYGYGLASKELLMDKDLSLPAKTLYLYTMAVAGQIKDFKLSMNRVLKDLSIKKSAFEHYKAELGKGYIRYRKCKEITINGKIIPAKDIPDTYFSIELLSRNNCSNSDTEISDFCSNNDTERTVCSNSASEKGKYCNNSDSESLENCSQNTTAKSDTVKSDTGESYSNNNIINNNILNNNIHPSINPESISSREKGRMDGLTYDNIIDIKKKEGHLPYKYLLENEAVRTVFVDGLFDNSFKFFKVGDQNIIKILKLSLLDLLDPNQNIKYNNTIQSPSKTLSLIDGNIDYMEEIINGAKWDYEKAVRENLIHSRNHEAYIRSCLISRLRAGTTLDEADILREFGEYSERKTEEGKKFEEDFEKLNPKVREKIKETLAKMHTD